MSEQRECPQCRGTGEHCHIGECTDPCDVCRGRKYIIIPDLMAPDTIALSADPTPPERLHADAALGREPGTTAAMEAEERGESNGVTHTFGPGDKVTHVDTGTSVGTIKSASPEYPAEYLYVEWADGSGGVYPRTKLRRHEEPQMCPKCGMQLLQTAPHRQRECQTISSLRDKLHRSEDIRRTMAADIERYERENSVAGSAIERERKRADAARQEAEERSMEHFRQLRASQHEARHWKGNHATLVVINSLLRGTLQLIAEGTSTIPTKQLARRALKEEAQGTS